MKAIKFFMVGLMGSALLFTACKKDSTTTDPTPSKSTYLTGKDWRMTGATLTSPGVPPVDIWAAMDPCDQDDLFEFLTAGTINIKAGATKCDPADPDSQPGGNWALISGETQLRIIDGDTTIMDIKELSNTSLKTRITEVDMGTTYYTDYTFVKN